MGDCHSLVKPPILVERRVDFEDPAERLALAVHTGELAVTQLEVAIRIIYVNMARRNANHIGV